MKYRSKYITKGLKNLFYIILFFTLASYESYAQTPTGSCGTTACNSFSAFSDCGDNKWKATMIGSGWDKARMQVKVNGSHLKCLNYTLVGANYGGNWVCSSNSANQIATQTNVTQYIEVNTESKVVTITTMDFGCSASPNSKDNNTTDLDQTASWTASIPTSGEVALWESTVNGANSVALGSNIEFQGIEIQDPGGLVTITAGNTLTLGTDGIEMAASTQNMTIASTVALGANQEWDVNTSKTLTASGVVSGVYKISKLSTGTLTLSGTNTFTGGVDHDAGTLNINAVAALGTTAGTLTIASGTTIDNNSGSALTIINYPISLNGDFTFAGTDDLNMGTGAVVIGANLTITATANDLKFGGIVSGAYDVTSAGSGNVYFTGESNSFTGKTNVGAGNVYFNTIKNVSAGASSLGAPVSVGNGTISIGKTTNNGALIFNGSVDQSTDRVIDLAGTTGGATIDAGASNNLTFTNAFTATGTDDKTLVLTGATTNNDIQGAIVDNSVSNTTAINKQGSGTWILSGVNTFTGTTTVTEGTLQIGSGGTTGSLASTSIVNGATLEINRSDAISYSGVISSSGAVTKKGTGTLTLSGANTYTGNTTITTGNIEIGAAGVIADGSKVDLNGGGLITGSGAGYSETAGIVDLSNNSSITLGSGNHTLTFAASSGETWTVGKLLTINGWAGSYNGTAAGASDPKIFIGTGSADLSVGQLAQIGFYNGTDTYEATLLATGELVPKTSVLPVELVHLSAFKNNDVIDLEWVTASEINSDYFEVLRTGKQMIFETIGSVAAAGQSSSFEDYYFTDYEPYSGVNYYKLIEYDIDGTKQESKIIEVVSLKQSTLDYVKTTSDGNSMFQLSAIEEFIGNLLVTSISGEVIEQSRIMINKGGNQFILNTSAWQTGYYVMTINSNEMEPKSIKFLIN